MKVTFYGVRGSIATPGPVDGALRRQHRVRRRAHRSTARCIVLDAGTGIRVLGDELVAAAQAARADPPVHHARATGTTSSARRSSRPIWRKDAHIILHALSTRAERRSPRGVLFDGEHFPVRCARHPRARSSGRRSRERTGARRLGDRARRCCSTTRAAPTASASTTPTARRSAT